MRKKAIKNPTIQIEKNKPERADKKRKIGIGLLKNLSGYVIITFMSKF